MSLVGLLSSIGIDVAFVALAAALCKYIDPAAIGNNMFGLKLCIYHHFFSLLYVFAVLIYLCLTAIHPFLCIYNL